MRISANKPIVIMTTVFHTSLDLRYLFYFFETCILYGISVKRISVSGIIFWYESISVNRVNGRIVYNSVADWKGVYIHVRGRRSLTTNMMLLI